MPRLPVSAGRVLRLVEHAEVPLARGTAGVVASPRQPTAGSVSARTIHSHSTARHIQPAARHIHTSAVRAAVAAIVRDGHLALPDDYVPPTQPPSAKRPDIRKTQLLRTYTSLLRTTPLMLLFQHSNLTGPEWAAVRRELSLALSRVTEQQRAQGVAWPDSFTSSIRMQVLRTRIFNVALRIVEFYEPPSGTEAGAGPAYTHDLSVAAHDAIRAAAEAGATAPERSTYGQLEPLLVGPLVALTFPAISSAHLRAALSVLAPSAPDFPPPPRKKNPGYYEPVMQNALPKLLLLGSRVEAKAFDVDGVRWIAGIEGGRAGLQAQVVALLQSAGLGLTTALEGAAKSLWLTMESRRSVLEEDKKE